MAVTSEPPAATVSDEALTAMIAVADLPSLLATLAHICGEPQIVGSDLRLDASKHHEPQGGWTEEQQRAARAVSLQKLIALRDAGWPDAPHPTAESVRPIIEWMMDSGASKDHVALLLEELGDPEHDLRAPTWQLSDVAPGREFRVAVIGAGMSGLLAAYRLRQAGIDVEVYEKNSDVGGTWLENTYPGCRVDVASHLYCYSFAQRDDWPQHFSTQPELLDYFRKFAADHDLLASIRFDTEVKAITWDGDPTPWSLSVVHDGADSHIGHRFHAVINATGQLNRPKYPDLPGFGTFAGPAFHSAHWDHGVDLFGKRVAVIGTGASAAQFIPIVAEQAAEVLVMQRTPNWLAPTLDYHDDFPAGQRWLLNHVPYCSQWYRFWLFWRYAEGMLPACHVDPEWDGQGHSVSELNEQMRMMLGMYLGLCFGDRPDLLAKVMPDYPPAAKRILRDNGIWATTLKRDNVQLITDHIAAIEPTGLRMDDGTLHEVDVLIFGTGFQASKFLTPMHVTGRGSARLPDRWNGNARAYLGIVVPDFPNFFMLYGPNTNIVVNGSIIYFSECEVHYVMQYLRHVLQSGAVALSCKPEVHDAYNVRIDEGNTLMAWGASDVNSWYKSASGRVAQNWPFSLLEFWQQTRDIEPSDYDVIFS